MIGTNYSPKGTHRRYKIKQYDNVTVMEAFLYGRRVDCKIYPSEWMSLWDILNTLIENDPGED